jgi:hypothetical protein
MYIRKSQRACNAVSNDRYGRALRIASMAILGPQFIEDDEGNRVRVWGDGMEDWVTADDVRSWLLGNRVVELREGLEFVREDYVKMMVREGYLRKDARGSLYWVTEKAAWKWDLPKVMGCAFPK